MRRVDSQLAALLISLSLSGVWGIHAATSASADSFPLALSPGDAATAAQAAQSEGDRLLRSGDVKGAAKSYQRAAQSAPNEPLYQITSGVALASAGRMEEALAAFQAAQRLTGGNDQVVALLLNGALAERADANVNSNFLAQRAMQNNAVAAAAPVPGGAVLPNAVGPSLPSAPRAIPGGGGFGGGGGGFGAAGGRAGASFAYTNPQIAGHTPTRRMGGLDTASSLQLLQEAATRFPQSPMVFLLLGDARQLSQHWTEADTDYHRAIHLAPHWAKPRVNLGLSLLAQGRATEAIHAFQSALALDPRDTQAQLGKGDAELRSGKVKDALSTYNNIAQSPNNQVAAQAATGIGEAYTRAGQYPDAVRNFNRAKTLDPTDPTPVAAMGEVQYLSGDYNGAANSYQEALRLSRDGLLASPAVLYRALGEAQLSARDINGTILTMQQALAQEPQGRPVWYRIWGQALFQLGDTANGTEKLKQSLESEGNRYPIDTLNAIESHGLTAKMTADYTAALDKAQTPAEKVRILRALAHLARFRKDAAEEVRLRTSLIQAHPSGSDWFALAEAYDLRAHDPANARDAYKQALNFGDLPEASRQQARTRLTALAP